MAPGTYLLSVVTTARGHGYRVVQRRADGWRVVIDAASAPATRTDVFGFADVNGDGHLDALLEGFNHPSQCGIRDVVTFARAGSATRLFHGHACEIRSELRDGTLLFREELGRCTDGRVDCYAGVRTTVIRWTGHRMVERRQHITCVLPNPNPRRACHPG